MDGNIVHHSFGPSSRNHYLFHYVISGSGTLMANDSKELPKHMKLKVDRFLIFPNKSQPILLILKIAGSIPGLNLMV